MPKVDVPEFLIKASAIIGIGLLWSEIKLVLKMFRTIAEIQLHFIKKELESLKGGDCGHNEEGYCSDDCGEARPQIPEPTLFYIS